MPIVRAPEDDVDVSILMSTPELGEDYSLITDEMRDVMEKLLDDGIEQWELSFIERKIARKWGWIA